MRKRSETGPARRRRAPARASNVARSRTRQIRPRGASGRGPGGRAARRGPPWCASGGGSRGSWRACDCWAGTCASTEEPPRGGRARPEVGDRAGGGNDPVYGSASGPAQCGGGPDPAILLVWGKPPRPLVAQGRRCYVARLARPSACCPAPPMCHSTPRPNPCNTSGAISTPVDAPVDNSDGGRRRPPVVVAKERWVLTADEIWDQGSATLREQLAPATWAAWFPGVRPLDFDGETLLLSVPSSLAAERIRSSYSGMLTDAIRDSTGVTVRVELLVETEPKEREVVAFAARTGRRGRRRAPARRSTRSPALRAATAAPPSTTTAAPPPGPRARSTPATPSTSSSSARPTASPTPPPCRSPRARAGPTTRSSSTGPPAWARPTSSTPSATTSAPCSATSGSATSRPSRS